MSLTEDLEYARANCEGLIARFPSALVRQEAAIPARLAVARIAPLKKLAAVYELLDAINHQLQSATPCEKGCSGCCHYAVSISEIEIRFIETHGRIKRRKTTVPKADFHGAACPFLKAGACSIYAVRPYACRRHHSLAPSARWCAPELAFEGEFARLEFSDLQEAFDALRVGSPSLDIRQVFGA